MEKRNNNFIVNRLATVLESAPIAIFCLVTETKGHTFRSIPGFYLTRCAVDYTVVIFQPMSLPWNAKFSLLLGKHSYATQLTRCPYFRQIAYATPLHMRRDLSERGLLTWWLSFELKGLSFSGIGMNKLRSVVVRAPNADTVRASVHQFNVGDETTSPLGALLPRKYLRCTCGLGARCPDATCTGFQELAHAANIGTKWNSSSSFQLQWSRPTVLPMNPHGRAPKLGDPRAPALPATSAPLITRGPQLRLHPVASKESCQPPLCSGSPVVIQSSGRRHRWL